MSEIIPKMVHQTREVFDRYAADYDQRARLEKYNFSSLIFQRRKELVLDFIDRYGIRGRLLDFGMGPGVFAGEMSRRGIHFHGIDVAPEMVRLAEEVQIPNATYEVGGLETLNRYRGTFDALMAIGLIDYLEDTPAVLTAFAQTLKPGGYLLVSFRNKHSIPTILRDSARRLYRSVFGRGRFRQESVFASGILEKTFSAKADLQPLLNALHFEVLDVAYQNCSPFFFNFPLPEGVWRFWQTADRRLAGPRTRWMCSGGVLCARKKGATG